MAFSADSARVRVAANETTRRDSVIGNGAERAFSFASLFVSNDMMYYKYEYTDFADTLAPKYDLPAPVPFETPEPDAARKPAKPDAGKAISPQISRSAKSVHVIVEKKRHKLAVMRGSQMVKEYNIAVGKATGNKRRVGDMRTPEGIFSVQMIQNSSKWKHDFGDGKGLIKDAYGPFFIRLKAPPWQGIGIHGTHAPNSIGSNISEGCVRMNNRDLIDFVKFIRVGTKVTIKP
ncbi:hypothetical protein FACS1894216_09320 [Synergistales bacterium]|nr:hypothetical protein FACS1894216_09320 [Synergistales bacterium]